MKINAYYHSIPASDQAEEFACANWWKTSWTANGWEPLMLNRSHAQASSFYGKLQQKLAGLALSSQDLVARIAWHHTRFNRWCALHAAGGGWMSDYDVVNIDLTPVEAKKLMDKTILINEGPAYLFYVTKEHCGNVLKKFLIEDLSESGKIRPEIEILGLEPEMGTLLERVVHVNTRGDGNRSIRMKEIFQNK
jgi:hypothetical protein